MDSKKKTTFIQVKKRSNTEENDYANLDSPVAERGYLRVGAGVVQVGGDDAGLHGHHHLGHGAQPRGGLGVAHVGLHRPQQQRRLAVLAEEICDRVYFLWVPYLDRYTVHKVQVGKNCNSKMCSSNVTVSSK